jgi:uncharacterized membrane protein (UPF0127 family)
VLASVHSNEAQVAQNVSMLRLAAALWVTAALSGTLTFPHGRALIRIPHKTVTVKVEIAETTAQLQQGLMGRRSLAPKSGMAFLFATDTRGRFWMKDTLIPLSIAFWGKTGRILRILDMAPCRADPCKVYDPHVAFRGALEVNRGAFARWGVHRGAVVTIRRR